MRAILEERVDNRFDTIEKGLDRVCNWINPTEWWRNKRAQEAKERYESGQSEPGDVGEFKRGGADDMRRILDEHTEYTEHGLVFKPEEGVAAALKRMYDSDVSSREQRKKGQHAWHLGDGTGQAPPQPQNQGGFVNSFQAPSAADVDLARRAEELLTREQGTNPGASILASLLSGKKP